MKRFWLTGLIVSLGLAAGSAVGQERPAALLLAQPQSADAEAPVARSVAPPRPLAIHPTEGIPLQQSRPALGRPQPLDEAPPPTSPLVQASWEAVPAFVRPVVRAKLLSEPEPPAARSDAPKSDEKEKPLIQPASIPPSVSPLAAPIVSQPGADLLQADGQDKEQPPVGPPAPRMEVLPQPSAAGEIRSRYVAFVPAGNTVVLDEGGTMWDRVRDRSGRWYGSAEYLLWWAKGADTPPLVTTSSPSAPQNQQGVLGQPTTTVLFGGSRLDPEVMSGGRFHLGFWFDCESLWALEGDYFFLGKRSERFNADSSQFPVIARPFRLRTPAGEVESAELVATPGTNPGDLFATRGSIAIDAPLEFSGAEANLRGRLWCGCDFHVDGIVGYRYLRLREGLHITEDIFNLRDVPPVGISAGDRINVTDLFDTDNIFHGGQIGTVVEVRRGRWSLEGAFKIALGNVHQVIDISGRTTITPASGAPPRNFNSGLLALASNSGTFSQDRFAVAPELGVKLGFQLTEGLRVFAGYNFLYLSSVVRPGDQIDRVLDVNQIPPFTGDVLPAPARPVAPFRTTDFWAQGLTFGLEIRY